MEIDLTLVSIKKTILITIIGGFILIASSIISSVLKDFQPFLVITIIIIGGLAIYFILKTFSRFIDTVIVNKDYIKVGDKYTIYWDTIKSYQYSNTGLLVGFVFRTDDKVYRLAGLLRGVEGDKFKLVQDKIVQIIDERNSNQMNNNILPFDFNSSKAGKRSMIITMIISITALLIVSYFMIVSNKKIKSEMIIKFVILCFMTLITIIRFFMNRK